jgi:hypothetical protein
MKKKFLVSGLLSIGILVGGFGAAYALSTFKASQEGFRQAGAGQATRLTMRVEAGMADANSDLVPDDYYATATNPGPGGALSFSIKNTSNLPIRVTDIKLTTYACGTATCNNIASNKNSDGTFAPVGSGGNCKQWVAFRAPASFDNWPTIAPRSTLEVNGTDNNRLGAGMLHLSSVTEQGCQGATFVVPLTITAYEWAGSANLAP